ncbi:parafibromin [Marchantia polymorpha subsp. ruderalis]
MDALAVLREYTVRNDLENVKLMGDEYFFGEDYRFPRNVETAYRSKQGSLYTLESLVFFVRNKHVKHTEYMQQARGLKLQIVTYTDRKPLQDYLEGKVSSTDSIELVPTSTGLPPREDRPKRRPEEENEAVGSDDNNAPSKRMRMEAEDYSKDAGIFVSDSSGKSLIEIIRDRERPVRDRESILICHNKNFQGVLALLKGRDDERRRADDQVKKEAEKPVEQPGMPTSNSASRYVNVEEKRFWKDHLGTDAAEELGIDPSQSYADSIKPKDNARPKPDTRIGRPPSQHLHHRPPLSSSGHKKPEGPPIIIVPSASQTMLNTYNAKEFFEDGVYVAPDVKAKSLTKKPEDVVIYRKMGRDHPVKYEIRDKPSVFSKKDWERVVAIFVLGKEWQFKDWPFKDHVEIFNQILGIFLRFEDDSVESAQKVKQWNVRILSLSKHKRHQDRTAALAFWDSLDKSVKSRKLNVII